MHSQKIIREYSWSSLKSTDFSFAHSFFMKETRERKCSKWMKGDGESFLFSPEVVHSPIRIDRNIIQARWLAVLPGASN